MHMRTEYIDAHFCTRCLRETEHVKFTYGDSSTLTCQFCQSTSDLVEEVEEMVQRSFTVISVEESYNNPKRRMVQAEIRVETTPDGLGEHKPEVEDIRVEYPAYEDQHFTAQVEPLGGPMGHKFNYKDAREVSKAIRTFIGKD